ncbi:peptidoglycan editing factor PgeF [Variovorax sp. RHLX14]|uniref:peptidoglycan editing factor PgeF n=1 Tax=Variovorax sp. RHLX14 TaxID=1259731 RepID=UPI003F47D4E1
MRNPDMGSVEIPSDWLIPDWPVPGNVKALCTTRAGGFSGGPYEGLNLGLHVGDAPTDVLRNRAVLRDAIGVRPVFLQQVHGTDVLALDSHDAASHDGAVADACMAAAPATGLACTIMVADCLPVLFADASGARVAAAHAGWRGLAAGVLERTLIELDVESPVAWLGPCIGPHSFEVGDEVRAAFVVSTPEAADCFRATGERGKWWADLPALARQRLRAAGVVAIHGNDGSDAWCTVRSPLRFFSHRRDGVSGRFAACIWLDGNDDGG